FFPLLSTGHGVRSAVPNKRMQSDVAFGHAADARRYATYLWLGFQPEDLSLSQIRGLSRLNK
ncbi:MAG: hypothetical protein AAGG02_19125, partial [Cyanobacteria bacterium P01_H01_bin.15]